jgi:hypothetical protein
LQRDKYRIRERESGREGETDKEKERGGIIERKRKKIVCV